jgi:hypothetical protein
VCLHFGVTAQRLSELIKGLAPYLTLDIVRIRSLLKGLAPYLTLDIDMPAFTCYLTTSSHVFLYLCFPLLEKTSYFFDPCDIPAYPRHPFPPKLISFTCVLHDSVPSRYLFLSRFLLQMRR